MSLFWLMNSIYKMHEFRFEVSFNTLDELRSKLSFYLNNNIYGINIPCKGNIKKIFLLQAIMICRTEFPSIKLIPHFSIQHEFDFTKDSTIRNLINFLLLSNTLECEDVLLVSGSSRRSTLDTLSSLHYLSDNPNMVKGIKPLGVAYNPYYTDFLSVNEICRLKSKLLSGFVGSIWIQFGTNVIDLDEKITSLKMILTSHYKANPNTTKIILYGSILIPSKLFNSRFRFRPWKGVYCSEPFLNSLDYANEVIAKMFSIYKKHGIVPIIATDTSNEKKLLSINNFVEI